MVKISVGLGIITLGAGIQFFHALIVGKSVRHLLVYGLASLFGMFLTWRAEVARKRESENLLNEHA